MDAKWTPEPWYIQIDSRGYEGVRNKGGFIAFSPSVSTFCDPVRFLEEREEVKANAERIVACVNALAGIENPAEYIAAFRAAIEGETK